jgi:iron complex outermembrane receptor protein
MRATFRFRPLSLYQPSLEGAPRRVAVAALLALGLAAALPGSAQEAAESAAKPEEPPPPETQGEVTEEITVTGTRFEGRAALETLAPVSYIDAETIESSGAVEVGKILQLVEPTANFSTTFISDGTDAIRPATLRSLGPDQTLLLVNGKRRHQQALVHYQQTVGRGSAGYDVNTIPASAIGHIEVLKDGAAAQYGSDAIAGVVNIILKSAPGTEVSLDYGQTYEGDGEAFTAAVNQGWRLAGSGFLNITAEYRDRGETNRAGPDTLRVSPPRVTQRIGDPDAEDALLWLNLAVPAGSGELYAFGGWSQRETNSSGFFRSAGDGRTVPALYPNGFLPTIVSKPEDTSLVVGYRGSLSDSWRWDLALDWGQNEFAFHEQNTVNVSWWYEPRDPSDPNSPLFETSPTEADTGTLSYDHLTASLDLIGRIDWGVGAAPLDIAFGAEWRQEGFEIDPGDPVSYSYGRANNRDIQIFNQSGGIAAAGTQGFPGFQDPVDESRDNVAAYADFEAHFTPKFTMGAAVRWEDYSDFGSTVDGKLSARVDLSDGFALRGTVSTGFRAPGVQQAFFTLRSTNLNAAGVLTDTLTAANNSPVARALGIPELKEETSTNFSLGLVARSRSGFRLTVDAYRIDIDDRIIFSDAISSDIPAVGEILNPFGIGQVQFFTNAIDTRTEGLDVVALYDVRLRNSLVTLEAAASFSDTEVLERRSSSAIIPVDVLFPGSQVTLVEEGQPGERYVLGATYLADRWSAGVRFNYFGSVAAEWFTQPFKQTWSGEWLTDVNLSFDLTDTVRLSVGGLNVFDQYPDNWDPVRAFPFPQLGFTYGWETVPFGINGGYYFARIAYRLKR